MVVAALVVCASTPADARNPDAILHERIPPDPREDVALSISLDGDLPAAIDTPSGIVPAPDPQKPPDTPAPYAPKAKDSELGHAFHPDPNTQKPDALAYDEPFNPSTAPFKRLRAYDQVQQDYSLTVENEHVKVMKTGSPATPHANEDLFYADMIVDVTPDIIKPARIPSVGPGARILRARAGVGTTDVPVTFLNDGADNWFVVSTGRSTRARLVMEIAVPRAALGGEFGDPSWAELRPGPPVPAPVSRAAHDVAKRIGIVTGMRPREIVSKMVTYFRAFHDSDDPPPATRDIYLDLALSQKGVCRHRAFAFVVTALALSIPARYIENEAHAWVEVNDGRMWRRIDLGGAGRMNRDAASTNVTYDNPSDTFSWPPGASRGQDVNPARRGNSPPPPQRTADRSPPSPADSSGRGGNGANGRGNGANGNGSSQSNRGGNGGDNMSRSNAPPDTRPATDGTLEVLDADARRGGAFHVRGVLVADGDPCAHTPVTVTLLSNNTAFPIGSVATDEHGRYDASITLNMSLAVGEYDVRAFTLGNTRCGEGTSK